MDDKKTITEENFNVLLSWLDFDRENAGRKYENIRQRLIRIFTGRGCFEAEELVDETFNRVTHKIAQVANGYDGDPSLYCYGVANKIYLEWLRRRKKMEMLPATTTSVNDFDKATLEIKSDCLDDCLKKLSAEHQFLIIEYYRGEKSAKIEKRRELAEQHGISANALQVKISRIRNQLKNCVRGCVAKKSSL